MTLKRLKKAWLFLRPGDYLETHSHLKIIWVHFLVQQIPFKWGKKRWFMAKWIEKSLLQRLRPGFLCFFFFFFQLYALSFNRKAIIFMMVKENAFYFSKKAGQNDSQSLCCYLWLLACHSFYLCWSQFLWRKVFWDRKIVPDLLVVWNSWRYWADLIFIALISFNNPGLKLVGPFCNYSIERCQPIL